MIDSNVLDRSLQRSGATIVHRGSRRRLRQLQARDYWTRKMSWLTAVWVVVMLVLIALLASRPNSDPEAIARDHPSIGRSH